MFELIRRLRHKKITFDLFNIFVLDKIFNIVEVAHILDL
jgi:hypothetical protein